MIPASASLPTVLAIKRYSWQVEKCTVLQYAEEILGRNVNLPDPFVLFYKDYRY